MASLFDSLASNDGGVLPERRRRHERRGPNAGVLAWARSRWSLETLVGSSVSVSEAARSPRPRLALRRSSKAERPPVKRGNGGSSPPVAAGSIARARRGICGRRGELAIDPLAARVVEGRRLLGTKERTGSTPVSGSTPRGDREHVSKGRIRVFQTLGCGFDSRCSLRGISPSAWPPPCKAGSCAMVRQLEGRAFG